MITRSQSHLKLEMLPNTDLIKKSRSTQFSKTRSGKIYSNLTKKRQYDDQISKYKNIKIENNEIDYYAKILLSLRNSI